MISLALPQYQCWTVNSEEIKGEARKVWRNFRRTQVDWSVYEGKDGKKLPAAPDLLVLANVLPMVMGKVYNNLAESDPKCEKFGSLLAMAVASPGQLGALNAESFCERMFSAANLVMDSGNTLLDKGELEMITLLRTNRKFMEFMRLQHPEVAGQPFGMTLAGIDSEDGKRAGASSQAVSSKRQCSTPLPSSSSRMEYCFYWHSLYNS
jgi:hypothetical protein